MTSAAERLGAARLHQVEAVRRGVEAARRAADAATYILGRPRTRARGPPGTRCTDETSAPQQAAPHALGAWL